MSLYLDTSALARLVVAEGESEVLREWLAARPDTPRITNVVGVVELHRFAARVSQAATGAAVHVSNRIDKLELTPDSLARAATLPPPAVRTLDAIHIASASELADLEALVTYDVRMISAAKAYGLPVVSPGQR